MSKDLLKLKGVIKKYRKHIIVSVMLLTLGGLPRSIELINHNYLWGYDQGLFYEEVRKMVVNRKPTLIGAEVGGQGGFFQGPGWYYLLSIPFILFNGDPYGGMILMYILGLLTILASFIVGVKLFNFSTGTLIAFLVAVSPGIIAQSRFIWPPFVIPLLSIMVIYSLSQILKGKQKYLMLLALSVGMMAHFEIATSGSLFLQLLLFSPFLFIKKIVSLKTIMISFGVLVLTFSTLIIFDLRHDFIISRGVIRMFFGQTGSQDHVNSLYYIQAMLSNHLDVFKFNFYSSFQNGGVMGMVILPIVILGSIFVIRDKKYSFAQKSTVLYLLLSPILLFLVFSVFLKPMWEWWILELPVYYIFLLGISLGYMWNKGVFKVGSIILIIVLFSYYVKQTQYFLKSDLYDYGGTHKIKGKIDALDHIFQDAKNNEFGLLVFTPPIYTYNYDYLLWWYGQRKYGYTPHSEKKGDFYLLIEPDQHAKWRHKGWLETVIKTGKVIKTEDLTSGFIVQKRTEQN